MCDGFLGRAEGIVRAGFNLNENQGISVFGDYINFAEAGAEVAGENLVTQAFKVSDSPIFTGFANLVGKEHTLRVQDCVMDRIFEVRNEK